MDAAPVTRVRREGQASTVNQRPKKDKDPPNGIKPKEILKEKWKKVGGDVEK